MNQQSIEAEPVAIVIFGASGDLTHRKLVPALHTLACNDMLHPDTWIIGVARTPFSDGAFRERLYEGVVEYSRLDPRICELWDEFAKKVSYLQGDYDDADTYKRLAEALEALDTQVGTRGNRLFYLAIPSELYTMVTGHLGEAGLNRSDAGWARIIVEKPFGRDLESARQLNEQIHAVFDEGQVYRIDHYLGKETVQNLLTFRFANAIFEPLWNRIYVDNVQISVLESIGVGDRAGYYDQTGVVRDMFQNHLLQLLTLTAMEPPPALNAKALRDEKVKVLQSIRPISPADGICGQYRGYRDEAEVAPGSDTPTYSAQKLYVDNWRWQGVPFYLRSGKRLAKKVTEITLEFKAVPHLLFPESSDFARNSLTLCVQPNEGMHLRFETKVPGAGMRPTLVNMAFHYSEYFGEQALPEAYERLLLDAVHGDAMLFTRTDEIELAWKLVDPLIAAKREAQPYEPGSWGPTAADALLAQDGREWVMGCDCESRPAQKRC